MRCIFAPSFRVSSFVVCVLSLCAAGSADAPKLDSLITTRQDGRTYFRARFLQPADAEDLAGPIRGVIRKPSRALLLPTLAHADRAANPIYPAINRTSEFEEPSVLFTFYGSTTETTSLPVMLSYPTRNGMSPAHAITLDLKSARPFTKTETRSIQNGRSMLRLTPEQDVQKARYDWLLLAADTLDDPAGFYRFAAARTAQRAGIPPASWLRENTMNFRERLDEWDYSLFTGSQAIRETMQLDVDLTDTTSPKATIPVAEIPGIEVAPLPYDDLIKGRKPVHSALPRTVPHDFAMLHWHNVAAALPFMEQLGKWGTSALRSMSAEAQNTPVLDALAQVALDQEALKVLLSPEATKEFAVVASDPFYDFGADLTFIFEAADEARVRSALDAAWTRAASAGALQPSSLTSGTVQIETMSNAAGTVRAYRAAVGGTVFVSNSQVALVRCLDLKLGLRTDSLANSKDFQFIRAELPQNAETEDGMLYLSDTFLRHINGPAVRIGQAQRRAAARQFAAVQNAARLYRYERGAGPLPSLRDLSRLGYLNKMDTSKLTFDAQTGAVSHAKWGSSLFQKPLIEAAPSLVNASERAAYDTFRDRYSSYWRQFFDPIAVRIKVGKTMRFDVHVMPLIAQSNYDQLRRMAGTKPQTLDLASISTATLVRVQVALDPDADEASNARRSGAMMLSRSNALDWVGNWVTFWMEDSETTGSAMRRALADMLDLDRSTLREVETQENRNREIDSIRSIFEVPLALGVHVREPLALGGFLTSLRGMVSTTVPNTIRFEPTEEYRRFTFVKVSADPQGQLAAEMRNNNTTDSAQVEPAIFYAPIAGGFYVTTQESVLRHLVDAKRDLEAAAEASATTASAPTATRASRKIDYSAFLQVRPAAAVRSRPTFDFLKGALGYRAERVAMERAWLAARLGLAGQPGDALRPLARALGASSQLPSGTSVRIASPGALPESPAFGALGNMRLPAQTSNPSAGLLGDVEEIRAWTVLKELGLEAVVEIETK